MLMPQLEWEVLLFKKLSPKFKNHEFKKDQIPPSISDHSCFN